MRRLVSLSRCATVVGGACLALALVAGGPPPKMTSKPPKVSAKKQTYKVDETVGDLADIRSAGSIHVEGVGLVDGLDGNGSDPEPGNFREKLVNRMKKDGVYKVEDLFATRNYSLVLISAYIPIGVGPGDPFDVEIQVPPTSTTKSLAGGSLFLTELREVRIGEQGQELDGNVLATAYGPVMAGENPRVGRVPGGAKVKKAVPYTLIIKEKRKSIQAAKMVQDVINSRFFQHQNGAEEGVANAKKDDFVVLNVPHVYHNNQPRYFQVLTHLCVVNKPDLIAERMKIWSKDLLDPKTAGVAALRLEGIGRNATNALKQGLESPNAQVRFFAAEALAYLNDSAGADVLAKTAAEDPSFRVYALRALAAMDHPSASLRLRSLMAMPDPEVRYGAFDALRALDPRSPHLGQVAVIEQEAEPEPDDDDDASMALQLRQSARRRRDRAKDPFNLYLVDSDGSPSVHVRRKGRCEVVVFGRGQSLQTPIVLGGEGPILLNAALDDPKVQISRIASGRPDQPDRKVDSTLGIGQVVREMANLGASYPSIVAVLQGAFQQGNLPGPLFIDAAPAAKKDYLAAQIDGVDVSDKNGNPKKDSALGKAGFDPSTKRRSLLNFFRKDSKDQ